jgi:hypothetical protein
MDQWRLVPTKRESKARNPNRTRQKSQPEIPDEIRTIEAKGVYGRVHSVEHRAVAIAPARPLREKHGPTSNRHPRPLP